MSDFLRPHGWQPIRLLRPWDPPGKITAVGCHFLLQGIFPTQRSIPGLLHCRKTLYRLRHQGSPKLGGSKYYFSSFKESDKGWIDLILFAVYKEDRHSLLACFFKPPHSEPRAAPSGQVAPDGWSSPRRPQAQRHPEAGQEDRLGQSWVSFQNQTSKSQTLVWPRQQLCGLSVEVEPCRGYGQWRGCSRQAATWAGPRMEPPRAPAPLTATATRKRRGVGQPSCPQPERAWDLLLAQRQM